MAASGTKLKQGIVGICLAKTRQPRSRCLPMVAYRKTDVQNDSKKYSCDSFHGGVHLFCLQDSGFIALGSNRRAAAELPETLFGD